MSQRPNLMVADDLCDECPLQGADLGHGLMLAPGGYPDPHPEETPHGLLIHWDSGDELSLDRQQVVELHRALDEYARRWA